MYTPITSIFSLEINPSSFVLDLEIRFKKYGISHSLESCRRDGFSMDPITLFYVIDVAKVGKSPKNFTR